MDDTQNQKGKITLGLITSWGLGVMLFLSGAITLLNPETSVAGLTLLLISLLLLPPVRRFVYRKTGKSLSTGLRVVCVLVLFGIGTANLPQTGTASFGNTVTETAISVSEPITQAQAEPAQQKGLVVEDFRLEMFDYGVGKVVGTLMNNTKKQYSYVQVEFNLYDDSGAQVGSTLANVNNLEPGGTWAFEAGVLEGRATQAKLKGVTNF
jgi:hypothetical protein